MGYKAARMFKAKMRRWGNGVGIKEVWTTVRMKAYRYQEGHDGQG